jgi:nucleoside-diphosphate-sugar epimerase
MVGGAILRQLQRREHAGEALALITRTHAELDLTSQAAVRDFMEAEQPDVVILAAAKVGGIMANNTYPADFIYENLMIECNVIHQAHKAGVRRLLQLGSSCIYPKDAPQPMRENALLTGPLEPTNEPYAIAKIAGIKLCESYNRQHGTDYRSVMPTNLYGPNDNFDLETSHVLPAMLRKFHEAKEAGHQPVTLWGSGSPMREFLYVDDVAEAVLFSLTNEMKHSLYNVGTGKDITVKNLALLIQKIVGHKGQIQWDDSKPDGTPRKLLDVSRMKQAGWTYSTELEKGVQMTYEWFLENEDEVKELKFNRL